MRTIRPGDRVKAAFRHSTGFVLRHHPTLPAWIVEFAEDATPLAWYDDRLEIVS